METVISLKNVCKSFRKKEVLHNINFEIEKGGSYGFVGYNGCGKSVLFKLICGLSLPDSGEIMCGGKLLGSDIDFIQNAGVVIESPEFIPYDSAFKNLKALAEIKNKITDDEILEALKAVGLYDERDKKVRHYSQGMKQRLRIAQAIMEKPETLIMDEPTNYLDKKGIEIVRGIFSEFIKQGGTLLMSSHNKDDINILCREVYELDNGEIKKVVNSAEETK